MANKVLIADDDAFAANVIKENLKSLGVESDIVHDGQECCEKLESNGDEYYAVLMDFYMPEMEGLEATRCIKDLGLATYVVGITSDKAPEAIQMGYDSGMDKVLVKPISIKDLEESLLK
mmetsp:Transcript_16102/g.23298  ORF Transcript_16102/g.23298 Transcript_16102/m.23298 type:complete len:119 (-) Transcript_16102:34-390(-)